MGGHEGGWQELPHDANAQFPDARKSRTRARGNKSTSALLLALRVIVTSTQ